VSDTQDQVRRNVGFLIWRLSMGWRAAMDRALEPMGLTQAQYAVLAPLHSMSSDGVRPSQRELADLTGLDTVYISKLVRTLERAGFIQRTESATDTRAVELSVTERGATTVRSASKAVLELREQLTKPLGGNDGGRTAELADMLGELLDVPELRRG
jgi:DNA-binding MarR family transcriptional regulator